MNDTPDASALKRPGLRILLTNNTLAIRAGSELYLRDVAIELVKRGHFPIAYSPVLGEVAEELKAATIPVIDDLSDLSQAPDIIHGQHHLETMTAVLRFPETPAIYVCHGWLPWEELPPIFPTISEYVAVDDLCRERLLTTRGISSNNVSVIRNFVDTGRFAQRRDWAPHPRSALIFSNTAAVGDARSLAITTACTAVGIDRVDIFGECSGRSHQERERVLDQYDVVFAKARCAIEAMASGAAVIVTDYAGLAGMVTSEEFERMRSLNFGARTMQAKTATTDNILSELQRYDAQDARRVSNRVRQDARLTSAVDQWEALYQRVIARRNVSNRSELSSLARRQMDDASRYLRFLAPAIKTRVTAEKASYDAARRTAEALQHGAVLQDQLSAALQAMQVRSDEHAAVVAVLNARCTEAESELIAHRAARDRNAVELLDRDSANESLSLRIAALTDDMAAAITSRDFEMAQLRAQTDRDATIKIEQLSAISSELHAIQTSRAWKMVQHYGRVKKWLRI